MIYTLKNFKWVAMSTNVYVDIIKDNKILLYHTKSGAYKISSNSSFIELVKNFYSPENLGVIESNQLYSKCSVDVEWALKNKVFIPINTIQKPIVLLPILNLQKDISKIGEGSIDDRLAIIGSKQNFISGIYIRISKINNICDTKCSKFRVAASKQYPCPTYSQRIDRISPEILSHILNSLKYTCVSVVDIVCSSDYFSVYSKEDFLYILSKYNYKYRIHFFIDDFGFALSLLKLIQSIKIELVAYVDKFSTEVKPEVKHLLNRILYLNYGEDANKDNANILPVYIGDSNKEANNIRIRREKEEGVFEQKVCFNDVFRNQKLNSHFFGIVDVDSQCYIRAYGSQHIIGNVTSADFSWTDIVVNELKQNHSWRLTRDMTNCKDCPLRYICPPISYYEILSNNTQICG